MLNGTSFTSNSLVYQTAILVLLIAENTSGMLFLLNFTKVFQLN